MREVRDGFRRAGELALALFLLSTCISPAHAPAAPASPEQGRNLFVGRVEFRNDGPPCGACHSISTIGFPNGGLLGPDLSGAYRMLGPEGMDATLQTLFFPTMMPLYDQRPLTPDEQQALKVFFQQAAGEPTPRRDTAMIAALALGGFVLLVAVTWVTWRHRLGAVRAAMVASLEAGGRASRAW